MPARASRLLHPEPPSRLLGFVVSALAIAIITAPIYPLKQLAPAAPTGRFTIATEMAALGGKPGPNPGRSGHLISDSGLGYRFVRPPS